MTIPFPIPPPLELYLLGIIEFDDVQRLQRRLVYDVGESGGGALILCEHPPTITVGRSGSRAHVLLDDVELREAGVRVHWVNRGGGCILHTPGQLVAYLILPLQPLGLTLLGYMDHLHQVLLEVLREFDLPGETRRDLPGVFFGGARVASIGVAVTRWIAYHGLTLNVGTFLGDFSVLEEPGIGLQPLRQTSMESRRQRPAPMPKVREALVRSVEAAFGLEQHHVYTDHPLIRRKARPHVHVPSLR